MEVEMKIHELLAMRTERRRAAFRTDALRKKSVQSHDEGRGRSWRTKPIDIITMKTRRDFLQEQLQIPSLTRLKRWHVELQLIETDEQASTTSFSDQDTSNQSSLTRTLAALELDRLCFDISYVTSTTRMNDLRDTLFDTDVKSLRVCEALAFSSTKTGYTSRVLLFRVETSDSVLVRSSLFVPDLQAQIDKLASDSLSARSLLEFLWQ